MAYQERRKLIHIGNSSRAVILPKPWLDWHGKRAENPMLLGDEILIIAPEGCEEKARRLIDLAEKGK